MSFSIIESRRSPEIQENISTKPDTYTPTIFQINAIPFLQHQIEARGLSQDTVFSELPDDIFYEFKNTGIDVLYLLGVFPESRYALEVAHRNKEDNLRDMYGLTGKDLRGSLKDFMKE